MISILAEDASFFRQRLYEHGDIQRASLELVSKAETRGACDNTSVLIIGLNQMDKSKIPPATTRVTSKKIPIPRSHSVADDGSHSAASKAASAIDPSNVRGAMSKINSWHHSSTSGILPNVSSFDSLSWRSGKLN